MLNDLSPSQWTWKRTPETRISVHYACHRWRGSLISLGYQEYVPKPVGLVKSVLVLFLLWTCDLLVFCLFIISRWGFLFVVHASLWGCLNYRNIASYAVQRLNDTWMSEHSFIVLIYFVFEVISERVLQDEALLLWPAHL